MLIVYLYFKLKYSFEIWRCNEYRWNGRDERADEL